MGPPAHSTVSRLSCIQDGNDLSRMTSPITKWQHDSAHNTLPVPAAQPSLSMRTEACP